MKGSLPRRLAPILAFAAVVALASFAINNSYYQLMLTVALIWATMGLAWNLLSGYTGLVSFGHAAFFGLGAYTVALAMIYLNVSPWLSIPVAALIGAIAALIVGLPTFRLRGLYFSLAMLAYPLAILYVFEWLGFQEVSLPLKRENPAAFLQFADPRVYSLLALSLLLVAMLVTLQVERTRFGLSLLAIRENEAAAEAAGVDTRRWKLRAIVLSGALAGAAGGFYACVQLVVTPISVFGMLVSAQALIVAMFGGVGTLWGPVIGALTLIPVSETLQAQFGSKLPGLQGVIYGSAIVAVILLAPEGLFWKIRDLWHRRGGKAEEIEKGSTGLVAIGSSVGASPPRTIGDTILKVENLSKNFGGVRAVSNVGFEVRKGEILGVIGPNGAGKTTLFNLINGFIRPDEGRVLLHGSDMVGKLPHALCRNGVGRTFQIMRPFQRLSVLENVLVGAFVHTATDADARAVAESAIARVGLADLALRPAGALTTKELRLMEIGRALAGKPEILFLDETLAGLGREEGDEVIAVVRKLAEEGVTIVIIEHTMHAMVRLVDRFVVLDRGEFLTSGAPEEVTRDRRVIEAYLGSKWSADAQG